MKTRTKNKSAHPAAPIMTPAQRSATGISQPSSKRPRKQTKDQQIAALKEDLRATQELLQTNHPASARSSARTAPESPETGGDTEPATENDDDDYVSAVGQKRAAQRPAGTATKLKRSRAIDPFESERIHPGTTGLVDNWRLRLAAPPNTSSPLPATPHTPVTSRMPVTSHTPAISCTRVTSHTPVIPEYQQSLSTSSLSTPTPSHEDCRPVYLLPRLTVDRQKVYPGIKDLPSHIRTDFRNTFIRVVIQNVFNSDEPWVNPDLASLQLTYDEVYPIYPARLRCNDAVYHPTVTSLAIVRNRIGTAAVFAVQRHLTNVFRQKRLQTLDARAKFVSNQFRSDDDHPFIWRQYVVGNIENHPEIGGYQTVRRGVFQCEPILETLLVYYSSYGIMRPPPTEDPEEGNRPIGALAMVTAAVERALRMHLTGDYVEATQSFNAEFWGRRTTLFMNYITKDLAERHWDGIFRGLTAVSRRVSEDIAIGAGAPPTPQERVPLPASDPPSPPAEG